MKLNLKSGVKTVRKLTVFLLVLFCLGLSAAASAGEGFKVCLAEDGVAMLPIVIAPNASEMTRENAEIFAEYLQKMTGAVFSIEEGDGSRGIVLGRQEDFPALPKTFDADPSDALRTEDYLLYTHKNGFLLVGATDLAAQNAMWDFLHRKGYRQYFPGPAWEVIPSVPLLVAEYDEVQKPDYVMRYIWYSRGTYPERNEATEDWRRKNRLVSGFHINAGHAYESFISRNKAIFDEHPEYYALVDGKRQGNKLNVANPDLVQLFVEYKLNEFRSNPSRLSVSVEPSDGGGWDESEEGKAIGSPSNQAVYLANAVAEAVEKEFPGRYLGMYAYSYHAEPPTIRVHPNIFVLVTTAFRGTSLSLQEQMLGWHEQGASLGTRDYLSYAAANYDIPDRCNGFDYHRFARNLKNYYEWGSRLYSGEASDNWGINGLLYYAMSRILWNVDDTEFLDGLFEEFLTNCFGPVADEIRPYYEALASKPVLGSPLFRKLYSAIQAAREKNPGDEQLDERLDALTVYVRYLELYKDYSDKSGAERQQAAREMFSHLYRARFHSANQAYAIMRDLRVRDSVLASGWTEEESTNLRRGIPIWETRPPYTREEILAMAVEGIENNPELDFEPIGYSRDLVPAKPILTNEKVTPGAIGDPNRGSILYYTWADERNSQWRIKVHNSSGNRILAKAVLWAQDEPTLEPVDTVELHIENGESGELVVTSPHEGLHWVTLSGIRYQKVELDPQKPWTLTSLTDIPVPSQAVTSSSTLYFYVPKGVRVIGCHVGRQIRGDLLDPTGKVVKRFNHDNDYIKINVPAGMDGRLWKLSNIRGGNFLLLTVPPYFATSPENLLLPREVVEADK